jgi:lipopolysaccharide/colanic/teichoic acid biosynthesis glycosyltransferase
MIKRAFDVVLSGFGLLVSAPLWVLFAAAIKLQDGGPIFFTQERVGRAGLVFKALKFRSMIVDADAATGAKQAQRHDTRVTPVGRLLRATAMDELPQLWNIFCGDMSFVGPRPLRPGEIEVSGDGTFVRLEQVPGYDERHRIRPGLTGVTQVFAPRDVPVADKFRLDLQYTERASLWFDVKLILLSFWITIRGRWEHDGSKI